MTASLIHWYNCGRGFLVNLIKNLVFLTDVLEKTGRFTKIINIFLRCFKVTIYHLVLKINSKLLMGENVNYLKQKYVINKLSYLTTPPPPRPHESHQNIMNIHCICNGNAWIYLPQLWWYKNINIVTIAWILHPHVFFFTVNILS